MTCVECGKHVVVRTCEMHNPKGAKICKDCCIAKMKGHACRWFELCW